MHDDDLGPPPPQAYEVTELETDDPRWMFELLGNPAFARVPPANYQALLERFTPRLVPAGTVLLAQGEAGDYFYLLRRGRARVTRVSPTGVNVQLAEIGPGECVGEEALLSGEPRNATVTLIEDGEVMCLAANDFHALLRAPLVRDLTPDAAVELLRQGAQLVDVREADEFRQGSIKGAINIPLFLLRRKLGELDRRRPCIVFCDDGRRSATAAFLLMQRGYDARVLHGGIAGVKKTTTGENT